MPSKGKQKAKSSHQDSDGEIAASQAASQSQKVSAQTSPAQFERRVNDLVQYLLIMDQKKLPIKKQDINKNVLKEFSKDANLAIQKATDHLANMFALDLVELQDKQKGSYVLVNRIELDPDNQHIVWPEEENSKNGLLMVILSLIFMNGNIMEDAQMWHALKKLGVDPDYTHEEFGDVKKLVTTEFVRQGYLEMVRQQNIDPPVYDFLWGQRSKQETSKRNVLDFVCQIYEREPQQWTSQWQDIEESEGVEEINDSQAEQNSQPSTSAKSR